MSKNERSASGTSMIPKPYLGGVYNNVGTLNGAAAGLNVLNNIPDDIFP